MESRNLIKSLNRDIKAMGGTFFIPLLAMTFGAFYVGLVYSGFQIEGRMANIQGNMGVFAFPLICMWVFGLFQDLIDPDQKECLLYLPYSSFVFGTIRVMRFTLLYIAVFYLVLIVLTSFMFNGRLPLQSSDFYLPAASLLFLSALSYFVIILTRNILLSYAILGVYCIFQYMTRGSFSAFIYPFQWSFPMAYASEKIVTVLMVCAAVALNVFAQRMFSNREFMLK